MVLSPTGSLSSSAMTTQLAMMVKMIVHSNTGQFTNLNENRKSTLFIFIRRKWMNERIYHVVSLRNGLDGVNRNSEVGPVSAGPSCFFWRIGTQPWPCPGSRVVLRRAPLSDRYGNLRSQCSHQLPGEVNSSCAKLFPTLTITHSFEPEKQCKKRSQEQINY